MTKRKSKGAYIVSAVAEMYEIDPQTLRHYEREGRPLRPSGEGGCMDSCEPTAEVAA
jgi:MerR family transcriptional regulator, heat shock protein HspR